jgi:XTP/dITP diphosphohydrolase
MDKKLVSFAKVLRIMDELRSQCPWDKEQTNESLRLLTIEETYELADAILNNSQEEIRKELGDLLLHIVFYAKIAEEKGAFDIASVCESLAKKLILRHPHIYSDVRVENAEDVKQNWEDIKLREGNGSTLAGVPGSLPSLIKAIRIQEKARGVGFDWDNKEQVWDKIQEELGEFNDELIKDVNDPEKLEHEFGDILFALVNYARFFDVNPENALERANLRFIERFKKMEELILAESKSLKKMNLEEMEAYWQRAKKQLSGKI